MYDGYTMSTNIGHSIPYELNEQEKQDFLTRNRTNSVLQHYLATGDPVYGIIVKENYGELLVWYAQGNHILHVIDVTNMAVSQAIQQAPYSSPDIGLIQNLIDEIKKVVDGLGKGVQIGTSTLILGAGLLWLASRKL